MPIQETDEAALSRRAAAQQSLARPSALTREITPALDRANLRRARLEATRAGLLGLVALRRQLAAGRVDASLAGRGVPDDPFRDGPLDVVATDTGIELRSAGSDANGATLVFQLER